MSAEGSRWGRANGGRLKAVVEEPRTLSSSFLCAPLPGCPVAVVITLQDTAGGRKGEKHQCERDTPSGRHPHDLNWRWDKLQPRGRGCHSSGKEQTWLPFCVTRKELAVHHRSLWPRLSTNSERPPNPRCPHRVPVQSALSLPEPQICLFPTPGHFCNLAGELGISSRGTRDPIGFGSGGGRPACTMNLWLVACLVICFLGTWAPTVQAQGVFEDCCLAYHPRVRPTVLRHALNYMYQDVSGSCNLPAVIFYFRHRQTMVCGNPQAKWVQNGMKLLDTLTKALPKRGQGTRRTFQGSHIVWKKLSSGTSSLPLSTFRGRTRSSKKNVSFPTTAAPGL